MKQDKHTIIIEILSVLLVASLVYIGTNAYNNYRTQQQLSAYQQGAQYGYTQALSAIFQSGSSCQPIPIYENNKTLTLIPLECIYKQATTCNPLPIQFDNQTVHMIATECLQVRNTTR